MLGQLCDRAGLSGPPKARAGPAGRLAPFPGRQERRRPAARRGVPRAAAAQSRLATSNRRVVDRRPASRSGSIACGATEFSCRSRGGAADLRIGIRKQPQRAALGRPPLAVRPASRSRRSGPPALTESSFLVSSGADESCGILSNQTQRFGQDRPVFQPLRERQQMSRHVRGRFLGRRGPAPSGGWWAVRRTADHRFQMSPHVGRRLIVQELEHRGDSLGIVVFLEPLAQGVHACGNLLSLHQLQHGQSRLSGSLCASSRSAPRRSLPFAPRRRDLPAAAWADSPSRPTGRASYRRAPGSRHTRASERHPARATAAPAVRRQVAASYCRDTARSAIPRSGSSLGASSNVSTAGQLLERRSACMAAWARAASGLVRLFRSASLRFRPTATGPGR